MACRSQRWAVLISGRGSNLAAILDCQDVEVGLVVSSSANAYGLLRARRAGIPTLILSKPINWSALHLELKRRAISRIFLAGFMRIVPQDFIRQWQGRIINLHPSLLPAYPGLRSIERAYADKADMGITVHEVVPAVDEGPAVFRRRCLKGSELDQYSLKHAELLIHLNEQRLVREAIRQWN